MTQKESDQARVTYKLEIVVGGTGGFRERRTKAMVGISERRGKEGTERT